jgi:CoA:oxalate CoA-transferase
MASGPLDGMRVLELTQIIVGPLGCQLLSDLGAEVIKVEPVNGEAWRFAAPFLPAESKWYHSLNRGKKSLAIDIADPQAQEAIHRLVRNIDVATAVVGRSPTTRLPVLGAERTALAPAPRRHMRS